ncbi:madf domain transcription factor [Holotrichia oblita]|uniref:Madf domain transcription factor n=1 Tax=Holotrichia oblita TaxID=644536 RepID=A0ACB9SKI5_HOLOL|nr:madf domain transcription factor [Holotrichia oblita]
MNDLPDVDVDRLISAVQSKPVLWDKTCEKYKDKFKTHDAWLDVCVEIHKDYDEFDVTKKMEFGKHILKKWTQVRDSYRKSKTKAKSGAGASNAKAYIYASQLQFLDKIFEERKTEDTLSQNIDDNDGGVADVTVENDENPILLGSNLTRDAAAAAKPAAFKKPASKIRKMDAVEVEMIAALKETPNRHLSFFKGLLPSLEDFDEFDTLDFQMEVLKLVKTIRQRTHPLPCTSATPYAPPCNTPPRASPFCTPSMVSNTYIQRQPNPQHTASAYQTQIQSQVPAVQFYEDAHNLSLNCLHSSSSSDSSEYAFQKL